MQNLSAGHHKPLLCKLTNTLPTTNKIIFIAVKTFIWLSYHLSSCQFWDPAERLPTRGQIRTAGLLFTLYTMFSFSYMKQSLNQVQYQYDTRKCCYHFRAQCQVSRKQFFFQEVGLFRELSKKKILFFFQKPFSEITSNPASPPSQPLNPWTVQHFLKVNMLFTDTKKLVNCI